MTVSAAWTAGPVIAPVVTSMPLGMSTATTGIAVGVDSLEDFGRVRPQRPRAGNTDNAVDDEIRSRRDLFDDPPAGLPECRQPLRVGAFRFEQYRVGARAAAAQEGRRPQRVTTVVARADDRAHPAAGDSASAGGQLGDDRGGQPVGCAPHQHTIGQAGQ